MFGRALKKDEIKGYRQAISQAKDVLDIRHLGIITPVRSLPTVTNTGVGSLHGAKGFFEFMADLGFDTVQIDPEGKTKLVDASPYTGTVFSTNPLNIDLQPLASDPAWGGLLSAATLADIERNNPNQDGRKVAYAYIHGAQEKALREAYDTFQDKLSRVDALPEAEAAVIRDISSRFEQFKRENAAWLEPDSLYEALSVEYNNDYWPQWQGLHADLDKHLFAPRNDVEASAVGPRVSELKQAHAAVIGAYCFTQFIASEQKKDFKAFATQNGFAVMADRQVGFSDRDVWAYRRNFLPGWALGAPPDYFSANGQAWGFPVLDPDKLFNPDGSLGEGGLLMKRLFAKIFEENPGGVRIDHIIGLIDPWVYPASEGTTKNGARLYSSPGHPDLGQYAYVDQGAIDASLAPDKEGRVKATALTPAVVDKYARILDDIVLAAAREKGVSLESILCEDLGTLTNPVVAVLDKKGLSGIRVSQFVDPDQPKHLYRGKNVAAKHWLTTGTHDNMPILEWAREKIAKPTEAGKHAQNLTEDLEPDAARQNDFRHHVATDPLAMVRAKFAELFASPARQVQVFFADVFGMSELYNKPGTTGDANWALRVPKDYEGAYFQALKEGRGLNLPEAFLQAMRAKGIQNAPLQAELEQYAKILKE